MDLVTLQQAKKHSDKNYFGKKIADITVDGTAWSADEVSLDIETDTFTIASHGLANGDEVAINAIGGGTQSSVPANESEVSGYRLFVINADADTFQLSDEAGGTTLNWIQDGDDRSWQLDKVDVGTIQINDTGYGKIRVIFEGIMIGRGYFRPGIQINGVSAHESNSLPDNPINRFKYDVIIELIPDRMQYVSNGVYVGFTIKTDGGPTRFSGAYNYVSRVLGDGYYNVDTIYRILLTGTGFVGYGDGSHLEVYGIE